MEGNSECWVKLPLGANPKLPRVRPISTAPPKYFPHRITPNAFRCTCTAHSKLTKSRKCKRQTLPKRVHSYTNLAILAICDTVMKRKLANYKNMKKTASMWVVCGSGNPPKMAVFLILHSRVVSAQGVLSCIEVHGSESLQQKIDFLSALAWRHSSSKMHFSDQKKGGNTRHGNAICHL